MSYDQYITWGENNTRYLDEDAIRREFTNAGVSYNGDFIEFIEMGSTTGIEDVNELRIKHAIELEQNRRNQENALFREMAAAQRRSQGVYVYVNQVPVDIYIPEFDAYDSVFLIHTDDSCRHTNHPKWLGPFQSQEGFFEYTQDRLSEGRHLLFCPYCYWDYYQNSSDPHFLPIGRAIRYTVEHGRPMSRQNAYPNVYLDLEQEPITQMVKGLVGHSVYLEHNPANPNCSLRRNVQRIPFKSKEDLEAFEKAQNRKTGEPNIMACPECYAEHFTGDKQDLKDALIGGVKWRGKMPTKEGYYILQDNHVYPLHFSNGTIIKARFFHPFGCDCKLKQDAKLLGPFNGRRAAFASMEIGEDRNGVRNFPCLNCYVDDAYEVLPDLNALYVPLAVALADYLKTHPIATAAQEQTTPPKQEAETKRAVANAHAAVKPKVETSRQVQTPPADYKRNEHGKLIPVHMDLLGYSVYHSKTTLFTYKGDTEVRVSVQVYLPTPPPAKLSLQCTYWLYDGPEIFDKIHQTDDYELCPIPDRKDRYYFGFDIKFNHRLKKGAYKFRFSIAESHEDKSKESILNIRH